MAIYKLPKIINKDNKPPFGARINWHHPLSQGLVGVWLFNEGAGKNAYNRIDSNRCPPVLYSSTGMSWSGEGLIFFNFGYYLNAGYSFSFEKNNQFSIVANMITTDTGYQPIVSNLNGDNSYRGYEFRIHSALLSLYVINNWGSGDAIYSYTTAGGVAANKKTNVAVTYNGSSSGSGILFYQDGKLLPSLNSPDSLTGTILDTLPLAIGARQNWSNFFIGIMYNLYIYNRVLSASEIASLLANPYQMFLHPVWDAYFVPAAAPPPTGGKSIFGYDSIFHAGGIIQT